MVFAISSLDWMVKFSIFVEKLKRDDSKRSNHKSPANAGRKGSVERDISAGR